MKPYLAPRRGVVIPPPPPGLPSAIDMGKEYMPREQMYAPTSFWNKRIPAGATVHAQSPEWVKGLCDQMKLSPTTGEPTTDSFATFTQVDGAIPVYVVPGGYPETPVTLYNVNGVWDGAFLEYWLRRGVPIPQDFVAGQSPDHYVNIVQPATYRAWEMFVTARQTDGSVKTGWGGYMHDYRTFPGMGLTGERDLAGNPLNLDDWFPAATSISLLGGILQREEVEAGVCNHPLQMSVAWGGYPPLWPARRSDGQSGLGYPPEGGLFRLKPDVDVDWVVARAMGHVSSQASATERARAADFMRLLTVTLRDYGMYFVDQTGGGCALQMRDYRNASGYQKGWPEWFGKAWYPYSNMGWYMWAIPWFQGDVLNPIA